MEKMKDTIYRLDTLNAIDDYFNPNHNTDELPAPLTEFLIAVGVIISLQPSAQPDNRLSKIAELVEGTIDHFELDDAMDLLYQIKEIVGNETSNI